MSDLTEVPDLMGKLDAAIAVVRADEREKALADAKARIEGERIESDGMDSWENGYHTGIDAALAALTQPQTEIEGKPDGTWYDIPDGGGAATAAGVADADLEGVEVHINGSSDLSPDEAKILGDAMKRAYVLMKERQGTTAIKPTPYAKAFREKFPVPEFPGIKNRQEDQA